MGAGPGPGPTRPVPAPPREVMLNEQVRNLTDCTERLEQIGTLPLPERSAGLAALHEELTSLLREAEG
ncbi:hypothetical protein [Actinomyces faecalis]|uniref:hypothetical protein n=1 Tax=Actinomyces faecalis TaxID=2722820 RepID=UPI001C550CDE|nr:hypothetical protein [Actinomyces faecalis]